MFKACCLHSWQPPVLVCLVHITCRCKQLHQSCEEANVWAAWQQLQCQTLTLMLAQAPGALNMAAVLQRFGLLSQVLQAAGSPARAASAEDAHTALHAQLAAAQAAGDLSQVRLHMMSR